MSAYSGIEYECCSSAYRKTVQPSTQTFQELIRTLTKKFNPLRRSCLDAKPMTFHLTLAPRNLDIQSERGLTAAPQEPLCRTPRAKSNARSQCLGCFDVSDERDSLASPRSLAPASCHRLATNNYMRDKKCWRLFCAMAAFRINMSFHIQNQNTQV